MSNWQQANAPEPHRCPLCGWQNLPKLKPVVEITPQGAGYCSSCGRCFVVPPKP